jgi:NAD-dependent SIR2 family protein deacetylase
MSGTSIHDQLANLLSGRRVAVLAGAGCSTESGIPDYRGPGSKRRNPMQYKAFVTDKLARARYWARSTVGWARVSQANPNGAHSALAALEAKNFVDGIITQNVDGLHHRAGSRQVVELHGSLSRVRCLACGQIESRVALQARLEDLNPGYAGRPVDWAPDGDAELGAECYREFQVPGCRTCGGVLKPDVVFFGENVPKPRVEEAWRLYERTEVLLVVGSSLSVFSGYRFVLRAAKEQRPVAIVNIGWTRGDEHAALKLEDNVATALPALAERLVASTGGVAARPVRHRGFDV